MASIARQQRLLTLVLAAAILGLAAQSQARALVEQEGGIVTARPLLSESEVSIEGGQDWQAVDSSFSLGTISKVYSSWLQQQFMVLEALQEAVMQSWHDQFTDVVDAGSTDFSGQQELLRHVGCARMRAALLDQATKQGRVQASLSANTATTSTAVTQNVAAASEDLEDTVSYVEEEEEYYEDYTMGSVASKAAYSNAASAGRSAVLAAAAADAASSSSAVSGAAAVSGGSQGQVSGPEGRSLRLVDGSDPDAAAAAEEQNAAVAELEGMDNTWEATTSMSAWQAVKEESHGDEDEDDEYEYVYVDELETYDLPYEYTAGEDVDVDLAYDDDSLYTLYGYDVYDDYEAVMTLADAMLTKFEMDVEEAEWADYLDQAYEYFTIHLDDEVYLYSDTYDDDDLYVSEAPNAVAMLASIAELVVWAHLGTFVMEVRPSGETTGSALPDSGYVESLLVVSNGPYYIDPALAAALLGGAESAANGAQLLGGAAVAGSATPGSEDELEVVDRFDTRLVYPDGSVNWELVTLVILAAGTVAMTIGFVVSLISLRRSMRSRLVYAPQQYVRLGGKDGSAGGCGACAGCRKGFECCAANAAGGAVVRLRPEDCHGAVCWGAPAVEDASKYVPEKLANESVAKALSR